MNAFEEQKNRQIVPRWLTFRDTCQLIPSQAIDTSWMSRSISPDKLAIKREAWIRDRRLLYAIDLVCSANLAGETNDDVVHDAASFILEGAGVPATIRDTALRMLQRISAPYQTDFLSIVEIQSRIRGMRKRTSGCRDPFLFLDLAFHYTLLAQSAKAAHCVRIALALGDDNPIVLRSAARFYLHAEKSPERALHLLRRSSATAHHPLLLASEISISEAFDLKSPFRRTGGRVLASGKFHPWLLAELGGTIGTLELKGNSVRRAKEAFQIARRCPNENTLAQLQWISPRLSVAVDLDASHRPEATFEADAFTHFRAEQYREAFNSAVRWMTFQPFTARPAILASFISSVALQEYDRSIELLKHSLIASPTSFTLRNNLAFALASKGHAEAALAEMRQVDLSGVSPSEAAVGKATLGLIAFRQGDVENGRRYYQTAVAEFRNFGDKHRAIVAEAFWAREELIARTDRCREIAASALSKCGDLKGFKVVEDLRKATENNTVEATRNNDLPRSGI